MIPYIDQIMPLAFPYLSYPLYCSYIIFPYLAIIPTTSKKLMVKTKEGHNNHSL
jgi:hypothetical protein